MFLSSGQPLECQRQQLMRHIRPCTQADDANAGGIDRFSKEMVRRASFETECLSSKMEGADLPASVSEQAVDAHGAEFDLIEGTSLLALGIDFRSGWKEADRLDRSGAECRWQSRLSKMRRQ